LVVASAAITVPSSIRAQSDSTLIKVRATGADSLLGGLPAFYSSGQSERATDLRELLAEADAHLSEQLGLQVGFTLAVLDESDWAGVWPFPYGLPYLSLGVPWTAVMPASPEASVLYPDFVQMLGASRAAQMVDNIGFHEVGHVYVSEFVYAGAVVGPPPVRWLDEFLATYLAYAFLRAVAPERAAIWDDFAVAATSGPRPRLTSLAGFDAEYYGYLGSPEGTPNYSWYQAVFAERAAVVYDDLGIDFVAQVRDELAAMEPASWTNESVLEALEKLAPGSRAWAEELNPPE